MEWPTITAETPVEEIQRIHKDIWRYVADYGWKPDTPYIKNCVACEYACLKRGVDTTKDSAEESRCVACPIDWGELGRCGEYNSLYSLYCYLQALDIKLYTRRVALVIRDIPFKDQT